MTNLTKKEYVDDSGANITEYRNKEGQLHNPEGPAVSGGKAPVYAINGNIIGSTFFKACLALGTVDTKSLETIQEAQKELDRHDGRSGVGPMSDSPTVRNVYVPPETTPGS